MTESQNSSLSPCEVAAGLQIFVSHSHLDARLANLLKDFLKSVLGFTASDFFCSSTPGRGVKVGQPIPEAVKKAISTSKVVVALQTDHASKSDWVTREVISAEVLDKHVVCIVTPKAPLPGGKLEQCRMIELTRGGQDYLRSTARADMLGAAADIASYVGVTARVDPESIRYLDLFLAGAYSEGRELSPRIGWYVSGPLALALGALVLTPGRHAPLPHQVGSTGNATIDKVAPAPSASLSIASAETALPTTVTATEPANGNSVIFEEPKQGAQLFKDLPFEVKGRVLKFQKDQAYWVYHKRSMRQHTAWPRRERPEFDAHGGFSVEVADSGGNGPLFVCLMSVDSKVEAAIRKWFEDCDARQDWPPLALNVPGVQHLGCVEAFLSVYKHP